MENDIRRWMQLCEAAPVAPVTNILDNPTFRRWFGDSKVVDEQGRPLVVYHGGPAGIKVFGDFSETLKWVKDTGHNLSSLERQMYEHPLLYFTSDRSVAHGYADDGVVYNVYLRMTKPLDLRPNVVGRDTTAQLLSTLFQQHDSLEGLDGIILQQRIAHIMIRSQHMIKARTIEHGYDGVILPDTNVRGNGVHTSYVVFASHQIKAIQNTRFTKSANIYR